MARQRLIGLILTTCLLLPRPSTCPPSLPGIEIICFSFDVHNDKPGLCSFAAQHLLCNRPNKLFFEASNDDALTIWLGYESGVVKRVTLTNFAISRKPPSAEQLAELVKAK